MVAHSLQSIQHLIYCRLQTQTYHTTRKAPSSSRYGIEHLPASVSMPGVDPCRNMLCGGVIRASRGDPNGCGVLIALCIARAPLTAMWANPGEWRAACDCGDDVICWLRPEGVRDGGWRVARLLLPGDRIIDGDGSAGGGCGVGVPAGESLGESSELMSILALYPALFHTREEALLLLPASARIQVVAKVIFGDKRKLLDLHGLEFPVAGGIGRRPTRRFKGASGQFEAERLESRWSDVEGAKVWMKSAEGWARSRRKFTGTIDQAWARS